MKTKRKAIMLVLCAVMLVVVSVMGTLAYLTDDDSVVNTFTVGKVYIDLFETDVDGSQTGAKDNETLPQGKDRGNKYHLLPGHTYVKDPTVTVKADSEDCYVRMFVEVKNLASLTAPLTDAKYWDDNLFLLQTLCVDEDGVCTWNAEKWECRGLKAGTTDTYEFWYTAKVEKTNADKDLEPLFTDITLPGAEFNNDNIDALEEVEIKVTAQAIQADGFATADLAWAEWK